MNLSRSLLGFTKSLYRLGLGIRRLLPRQRSQSFGPSDTTEHQRIERIYVINLDRQPDRWSETGKELRHILDSSGADLTTRTVRHSALDARSFTRHSIHDGDDINPSYTLGDQLFVEPQPSALPTRLELNRPIEMSRPEMAVARSHINVWRRIAEGEHAYALVLEDDIWFHQGFARSLDRAWREMDPGSGKDPRFDILYLSYREVKDGAPKTFLSRSVFRPLRGLWFLSGYVLSRDGAEKLLGLLPCRGPVDLWINHQFDRLDVRANRNSVISQRRDWRSTNSYSILPILTRIGVLDGGGESLFKIRPSEGPVFAFGADGSGLSSLSMALSMLGYRCCSDLEDLPNTESRRLLTGRAGRVFDSYINVGSMESQAQVLLKNFPRAKFFITTKHVGILDDIATMFLGGMDGCDVAILPAKATNRWQIVCEHLRRPPAVSPFPEIEDLGQRRLLNDADESRPTDSGRRRRQDKSPWIVEASNKWRGIRTGVPIKVTTRRGRRVAFDDPLENLDESRWLLRDDTFVSNLALFRPANLEIRTGGGALLRVRSESLQVRDYSAAAISSRDRFQFGRFEAVIRASGVPGLVTGFFLHRDSPRNEIDIEIVGSRPKELLVNVFYNPGDEGAHYDYGYRGTPTTIDLGFNASESAHHFAIEWDPSEIRWLVDQEVVHRRVNWQPTPIPQLPMTLHVNTWPTRSRELAGRLASRRLPATTLVESIAVDATFTPPP